MFKVSHWLALGAGAAVITLGLAAAEAHDVRGAAPKGETVAVIASAPVAATPEEKAVVGQAAAEKIVSAPACARKVKVVYSGYGEGDRAACPTRAN